MEAKEREDTTDDARPKKRTGHMRKRKHKVTNATSKKGGTGVKRSQKRSGPIFAEGKKVYRVIRVIVRLPN